MSKQTPIVAKWVDNFNKVFQFHPDRERIMTKILADTPISTSQIDKWFDEAHEATENYLAKELQATSGEPDDIKAA